MPALGATERTRIRLKDRAVHDRAALDAILDEGLVAHLGAVRDGQPVVLPMGYGREGEWLYLHGSTGSPLLRGLGGAPVCVTVTLLDGLVLARSAFHHSMNYRSAVIFGVAEEVRGLEARERALRVLTEHLTPGRWAEVRAPSPKETAATAVLAVPLEEASVKVRTGPPVDEEEDYALPSWAGVVPLALAAGAPIPDPRLAPGLTPPPSTARYAR